MTNFSRLKLTAPAPPCPDAMKIDTLSTNIGTPLSILLQYVTIKFYVLSHGIISIFIHHV
ncbi:hypothetical protein NHP164001_11150 [Helicobacter trogontum]|uniref:Uncharacterized protein n=1 Tax=Helicobacter trogontum TaxID=50960 RepID=A0ABQ0D427_9HELI